MFMMWLTRLWRLICIKSNMGAGGRRAALMCFVAIGKV